MNEMSGLYAYLMENITVPIYDMIRDTYRHKYSKVLEKTQWLSREEIEKIQRDNLRSLVKHAYDTVPYYHRIFKDRGLSPSDIKDKEDLVKLPIVTKDAFRDNSEDLLSVEYPKKSLKPYQSGGSTSKYVKFFITKDQLSWEIAAEYRAYRWAGYTWGVPCFMFWGSPIDLPMTKNLVRRTTLGLERLKIADSFILSEDILPKYAKELMDYGPQIVKGYTTSIYIMAQYLLENNVEVRPKAVITTAETLHDYMRETIEKAFDCSVYDFYGSREIGAFAAQCGESDGYHISAENVVLEFERDGEAVSEGETGQVLATSLRNYGMPFIRYQLGDVGSPSDEVCSCGRGLPMLSSVEGRCVEYLAKYDENLNKVIPVGPLFPIINRAMYVSPVKDVRIVQEDLTNLTIMLVKDKGYTQETTDFIVKRLKGALGEEMIFNFEFMDSIPPLASGKRVNFISKINPFN